MSSYSFKRTFQPVSVSAIVHKTLLSVSGESKYIGKYFDKIEPCSPLIGNNTGF